MDLPGAEAYILNELRSRLPQALYYHAPAHTLDVAQAADRIARAEGITDPETLALLRTAALFHDAGFLITYQGHEAEGSRMVAEVLPSYGYSAPQIELIQGMITATKISQKPNNKLEEIMCDADLDYLGRSDFEPIADLLYRELLARGSVNSRAAWDRVQIEFLTKHKYHTATALATRQPSKQTYLRQIRQRAQAAASQNQ